MTTQTTQDYIDYYGNLLIKQYKGLPKATATVEMFVKPILLPQGGNFLTDAIGNVLEDGPNTPAPGTYLTDNINNSGPILPLALQNAFNISQYVFNTYGIPYAVGAQLDIIGKYVGVNRVGQDFSGPVTLNDTQFLQLIWIKIALNSLKLDLYDIQVFIQTYFPGVIQIFDHKTMRNSYYYLVPVGSNVVAEFFIVLGLLPRPLGVGNGYLIYAYPSANFFSLSRYETTPRGNGLSTYTGPGVNAPLITYSQSITA